MSDTVVVWGQPLVAMELAYEFRIALNQRGNIAPRLGERAFPCLELCAPGVESWCEGNEVWCQLQRKHHSCLKHGSRREDGPRE